MDLFFAIAVDRLPRRISILGWICFRDPVIGVFYQFSVFNQTEVTKIILVSIPGATVVTTSSQNDFIGYQ